MTDNETSEAIHQIDIMQCADLQWYGDAWGDPDTQPIFQVSAPTLREALQECLLKLEALDD